MTDREDIDAVLAEGEAVDIAKLAQVHSPAMLKVLVDAARATDEEDPVPWAVRTRSAKDVIEIADGRPATKEVAKVDQGLTIVINQLFTDGTMEKHIPVEELAETVVKAVGATRIIDIPDVDDAEVVSETPED